MTGLHVTGLDPATGDRVDLWAADGRFVDGPLRDATELTGFVLPGFVDAHCHVGYSTHGTATLDEAQEQARTNLDAGALALRDCGSPLDTRPLVGRDDLPILIRAGRHIARPKRYIRELGVDLEDPAELPGEVARQLECGDGWIKIVGDWIDRSIGDLAPLWPDDILAQAIAVAHAGGARVTTHVFGEDALPGLLAAGVDCIEHGTGLTDQTIADAAERGVHLVPTVINIANFPSFAAAADRFPTYAKHMVDLHRRNAQMIRDAMQAGIEVHAGTDAGGFVEHGRVADEVRELGKLIGAREAMLAASHRARDWLGLPSFDTGEDADLVVYPEDPALDLGVLSHPAAVVRAGRVKHGSAG
jgi:imidazolonepropionase-like amidohydrolase